MTLCTPEEHKEASRKLFESKLDATDLSVKDMAKIMRNEGSAMTNFLAKRLEDAWGAFVSYFGQKEAYRLMSEKDMSNE